MRGTFVHIQVEALAADSAQNNLALRVLRVSWLSISGGRLGTQRVLPNVQGACEAAGPLNSLREHGLLPQPGVARVDPSGQGAMGRSPSNGKEPREDEARRQFDGTDSLSDPREGGYRPPSRR